MNVSSNGEIFGLKSWMDRASTIVKTLDKVYNLDWYTSSSKNECSAAIGLKWMLNQRNRVHASILNKFISFFDKKINEYSCYQISKASFASYSNNFKYVKNTHKVIFSKNTDVKLCDEFGGSFHAFNFITIDDLLFEKIRADTCIDVIGIIKNDVFVQDITKRNGKPAKKLPIDLYGSNNPEEAPVVVILQFATYKPYDGVPGISNALSITKLIINEEIPEIVEFKKSLLPMIGSETSSSSLLSPLNIRDPYFEEFVNEADFSNVEEVEDIETPNKVVICGNIIPSSKYNSWYRIPFDVQDSTGSLALTLWEAQAVPIFKITAMELFKKLVESGDDTDIIPKEVESIEDQIYALKINIQQYNIDNQGSSYNIFRLTKEPKIISELQEKHGLTLATQTASHEKVTEKGENVA
ncbi:uncharacterized protein LOC143539014 [Bidens hawaiensis]|uniref:uncharacterized protein LOC143539014 n=1 Tax=Bidens hawaiensis TaxID=980011 RepID=UPI00404B6CE2